MIVATILAFAGAWNAKQVSLAQRAEATHTASLTPFVPNAPVTLRPEDCGWDGKAWAFLDENANGAEDPGEPPLAGVQFKVDDVAKGLTNIGTTAISDQTGKANFSVRLPGCPRVEFEVYAQAPVGYGGSTTERLTAREVAGNVFVFGFFKR